MVRRNVVLLRPFLLAGLFLRQLTTLCYIFIVDFVLEKKFGVYKPDKNPSEIAETVSRWLQNPSLLSEMSKYALEAGRPNAAEEIVRKIGKSVIRWKESHPEDNVKGLNHQVSQVSC